MRNQIIFASFIFSALIYCSSSDSDSDSFNAPFIPDVEKVESPIGLSDEENPKGPSCGNDPEGYNPSPDQSPRCTENTYECNFKPNQHTFKEEMSSFEFGVNED